MVKSTRLAFLVLLAGLACLDASAGRVSPSLEAQLKGKPSRELLPIIVELEDRAIPSNAVKGVDRRDRVGRGRAVVNALQRGLEDVFVGDIAEDVRARLAVNPKALERELGS